jgi:hypothetical protein
MSGAGGFGDRGRGDRFGGFHGARFGDHDRFRDRGFFGGGWGWDAPYYDYGYGYGYPDYGYGNYDSSGYGQSYASQYWYYCQNPAGYYPYVQQCTTNWQPVPAG